VSGDRVIVVELAVIGCVEFNPAIIVDPSREAALRRNGPDATKEARKHSPASLACRLGSPDCRVYPALRY
jgi:hypothetical protein